jgi:hypothetical protein
MYSIHDSAPVDDLCPVGEGFAVANGHECSASTLVAKTTLTDHIPSIQRIKDSFDRKRAKLVAQRPNKEVLRQQLGALFKAETHAINNEHDEWERRYGKKP